jgi:hypothetical protein
MVIGARSASRCCPCAAPWAALCAPLNDPVLSPALRCWRSTALVGSASHFYIYLLVHTPLVWGRSSCLNGRGSEEASSVLCCVVQLCCNGEVSSSKSSAPREAVVYRRLACSYAYAYASPPRLRHDCGCCCGLPVFLSPDDHGRHNPGCPPGVQFDIASISAECSLLRTQRLVIEVTSPGRRHSASCHYCRV